MALSLNIKANDVSKVDIYHPATKEKVGTLHIAGPDHHATKEWRREMLNRRQRRDYRENVEAESKEGFCKRIVGWEGVKDTETGEEVPFNPDLLPGLSEQGWLLMQVTEAMGEDDFFFRE